MNKCCSDSIVRFAKHVGFGLNEVKVLLEGFEMGPPSQRWHALARRKLSQLDQFIAYRLLSFSSQKPGSRLLNRNVTRRDRSAILGDARSGNLYRIQRAAHRESLHCRCRIHLESDLSTRHRSQPRGTRPGIHFHIRVHNRTDTHRDHGQMLR